MIVQSFGSGSSGNAMVIRTGSASILVDCGLGPRTLKKALEPHRVGLADLDAVFVTHEHDDHVRGLAAVAFRTIPLHTMPGTALALGLQSDRAVHMQAGSSVSIGDLTVEPLVTSHDASEPCGYTFATASARVTVLTDIGEASEAWLPALRASDLIVLEANHDLHMLRSGPYPAHLKRRVMSARGHLSNEDCGALLARALTDANVPRTVWLAHLSATNNRPDLAVRTVSQALGSLRCPHAVIALPRRSPGPVWSPESPKPALQMSLFPG